MTKRSLNVLAGLVVLCFGATMVSASTVHLTPLQNGHVSNNGTVNTNVPFPTAGDAYCSATGGCGNIPAGGQTAYQWTTGDFVISSIFTLPTNSVTDITANWIFQDFLGGGGSETWYALVNGVTVAQTILPDCGYCGSYFTVTGTVNFADIAPVNGGYQVELVLQNTVPPGEGSVAWADGGITGLSYAGTTVPEPSSIMLFGSGLLGLAGALRRKLS